MKCIEDEIPFEIPEGWAWTRLGTAFTTLTGSTPSTQDKSLYGNEYPFYKPTDLDYGFYIECSKDMVSLKGYNNGRITPQHSILVTCIGATIGKTGFVRNAGICNQQINAIVPNPLVYMEYFYFLFCSKYMQQSIKANASATTLPILNKSGFDNLLVPMSPLKQQEKITNAIIDTFSFVENIEKDADFLEKCISVIKSKILDLAIRGKLVPQDPNDEPASALLERIKAEKEELIKQGKIKRDKKESIIFKGEDNSYYQDLPKNWEKTTLRKITTPLTLNDGDWILTENMNANGEVKLLQLGSIGNMMYIDKGFKFLTKQTFDELSCTAIFPNYLIINRIISDKMCCCIIPNIEGTIITTVDTCWIAPCPQAYNLKFLMYQLASPTFQSMVLLKATGTTRKRISKNNLIDLPLLFPPLAEQKRIVEAIEAIFAQLNEITNSIA